MAIRESRVRKHPSPGAVCYHAQQCIEKYLKAVLQERQRPIPKTHDLHVLLVLCGVDCFEAVMDRDGLVSLSRYATLFRYPGELATSADAKQAIQHMRRYRKALRNYLDLP